MYCFQMKALRPMPSHFRHLIFHLQALRKYPCTCVIAIHPQFLGLKYEIKGNNIKYNLNIFFAVHISAYLCDPYQWNQFSLQKMYLTKEEEPNDSPSEEIMEEQETTVFDPKSFLESLFNSRQAEIEVLLHNNASYNQNITRYSNFVTIQCDLTF